MYNNIIENDPTHSYSYFPPFNDTVMEGIYESGPFVTVLGKI